MIGDIINSQVQAEREREMAERGRARAESMIARSLERGEGSETPAGIELAKRAIAPFTKAIEDFLAEAFSGRGGRRHAAAVILSELDPDLTAFITVRATIASACWGNSLRSTAASVAERIELEM